MLSTLMATRQSKSRSLLRAAERCLAGALAIGALGGTLVGCGAMAKRAPARHTAVAAHTEPPQRQNVVVEPQLARKVIARVGHHSITVGYLERWTPLEIVLASSYRDSVPTGFVPDPPAYRNCIAYLASLAHDAPPAAADREQLERACEKEHTEQWRSTLSHLIKYTWIYEEAAKRGVTVSDRELQRKIEESGVSSAMLEALGVPPAYQRFVAGAELRTALIYKALPLHRKLRNGQAESIPLAARIDNEENRFYGGLLAKWSPRTHCDPEYIVVGCSEFSTESQL